MQVYKNLAIIGTSHISIESVNEVKNFIEKNKPEIIALELDQKRYLSLVNKENLKRNTLKEVLSLGIKGYLINVIGSYIEKKLGKVVGVKPGSEMIEAISLAKKYNLKLALIDQDITITLKKLSKEVRFREKFKIFKDILKGIFSKKQEVVKIDLRKVPSQELINKIIKKVKKDYPGVYNVLIKERNEVMAKALNKIINLNNDKKILAIIGAGHEKEVIRLIRSQGNN